MRKIVIAPDSFKGSLSSREVADAVVAALRPLYPLAQLLPVEVADGGEGTALALTRALGGQMVSATVSDPLGRPVQASYGLCGPVAVIEMAAASGLPLLAQHERNPLLTSTYGTGELILDALRRGCNRVLVGIGGSATNDGGMGMLSALGARFYDAAGALLPGRGCDLEQVSRIDTSGLCHSHFTVACDVDTTFCDAARVFGAQKGASPADIERLTAGLEHFAAVAGIAPVPGSGAAGGLGGAFHTFLNAKLEPGVEMVLQAIGFDEMLRDADLVITGEGKADAQTPHGKTAAGVLAHSKAAGVPVLLLAGQVEMCPELASMGFSDILQVTPPDMPLFQAMQPSTARENIMASLQHGVQ